MTPFSFDKVLATCCFVLIALALLLWGMALHSAPGSPPDKVPLLVTGYDQRADLILVEPMVTARLGLRGPEVPAGEVLNCSPANRRRTVRESDGAPATVTRFFLSCEQGEFEIVALGFE